MDGWYLRVRECNMLTEKDYCDKDTCVALKELGYPIDWFEDETYHENSTNSQLYEAQKWLREEKNIIVEVFVDDDSDTPITYNIYKDGQCVCHHHGKYWSVEEWSEALSEGIKERSREVGNRS